MGHGCQHTRGGGAATKKGSRPAPAPLCALACPPPRPQAIAADVGVSGSVDELCRNDKVGAVGAQPPNSHAQRPKLVCQWQQRNARHRAAARPPRLRPGVPRLDASHPSLPPPLVLLPPQVNKALLAQLTATAKEGKLKVGGRAGAG